MPRVYRGLRVLLENVCDPLNVLLCNVIGRVFSHGLNHGTGHHVKVGSLERNMREVGILPLSKEIEARTGKKEKLLTIYNYCSPLIARRMADFSPHMAAYMPCRITLVEKDDGLWRYTLNMDMMVKMGRKLPSPLKEEAWSVRETMYIMMERASKGEF
jgi:hypothetical protein